MNFFCLLIRGAKKGEMGNTYVGVDSPKAYETKNGGK